jgi:hypothetical protein
MSYELRVGLFFRHSVLDTESSMINLVTMRGRQK